MDKKFLLKKRNNIIYVNFSDMNSGYKEKKKKKDKIN